MAWSPKRERFHPPKLWKAMGTGMGTLMPTMPACTRWAKSRAVSPSRVKMGAVAELVVVDEFEGGVEVVGANDAEDGAEDLFFVDAHLGLDVVEEAGAEEEAFAVGEGRSSRPSMTSSAPSSVPRCDVAGDFVEMGAGDERAEVGSRWCVCCAVADAEGGDARRRACR